MLELRRMLLNCLALNVVLVMYFLLLDTEGKELLEDCVLYYSSFVSQQFCCVL